MFAKKDIGLEILLDLSGTEYTMENGYWYKIEARKVEQTAQIPHGIRYCLTLHDNFNQRIFGMDNTHAVKRRGNKLGRSKYQGRVIEYDHLHQHIADQGTPYDFTSAKQLLADFFARINTLMRELGEK